MDERLKKLSKANAFEKSGQEVEVLVMKYLPKALSNNIISRGVKFPTHGVLRMQSDHRTWEI
jgi:hypothetical protein